MKIKHVITEDLITTDLQGSDKTEVITELLNLAARSGNVKDVDQALKDLLERERRMSTGMQFGVAIPHAKTTAVSNLVACIGIHREGVEFSSLDGNLSHIFIMTLSPVDRTGPHVQFLAEISMVLKTAEAREKVLSAAAPADVLTVFGL